MNQDTWGHDGWKKSRGRGRGRGVRRVQPPGDRWGHGDRSASPVYGSMYSDMPEEETARKTEQMVESTRLVPNVRRSLETTIAENVSHERQDDSLKDVNRPKSRRSRPTMQVYVPRAKRQQVEPADHKSQDVTHSDIYAHQVASEDQTVSSTNTNSSEQNDTRHQRTSSEHLRSHKHRRKKTNEEREQSKDRKHKHKKHRSKDRSEETSDKSHFRTRSSSRDKIHKKHHKRSKERRNSSDVENQNEVSNSEPGTVEDFEFSSTLTCKSASQEELSTYFHQFEPQTMQINDVHEPVIISSRNDSQSESDEFYEAENQFMDSTRVCSNNGHNSVDTSNKHALNFSQNLEYVESDHTPRLNVNHSTVLCTNDSGDFVKHVESNVSHVSADRLANIPPNYAGSSDQTPHIETRYGGSDIALNEPEIVLKPDSEMHCTSRIDDVSSLTANQNVALVTRQAEMMDTEPTSIDSKTVQPEQSDIDVDDNPNLNVDLQLDQESKYLEPTEINMQSNRSTEQDIIDQNTNGVENEPLNSIAVTDDSPNISGSNPPIENITESRTTTLLNSNVTLEDMCNNVSTDKSRSDIAALKPSVKVDTDLDDAMETNVDATRIQTGTTHSEPIAVDNIADTTASEMSGKVTVSTEVHNGDSIVGNDPVTTSTAIVSKDEGITNNASVKTVSGLKENPSVAIKTPLARKLNTPVSTVTMETSACQDAEEGSWDALFDEKGDALDPRLMDELTIAVGKDVEVKKTQFDYYDFQPRDPDMNYGEYAHLIEIHDFPKEFITRDLIMAFKEFEDKGFEIKWVDDTHAIGVFSSPFAAQSALQMKHPLIHVRPLSQAIRATKVKAKKTGEFLQPYKPRPETMTCVVRNLVASALGLQSKIPREVREEDRRKLKEAKDRKRELRKQKQDTWDGNIGKCAMDD